MAFRIPLNGCGSGTQVWSRQVRHSVHEPETYLHSKLLNLTRSVTLWTSPPGSLRPHEDGSTSLGAVLISERLVTNDSGFPCLSAIVYTCPSKWSTLPSSWVTRSLSVSLTTAAADSTLLLSSCTWYNKKRISRNRKVFTQNSALIPPKAK